MNTILVTGGTGLIGGNTVRFLAEQGREVVAYDLFPPPRGSVLADVLGKFELEIGNITDLSHVLRVIKKHNIKGIIHCAAMLALPSSEHPIEALQVNIMGTANMLEAARIADLERVVVVSASAVFGGPTDLITPRKEEDIVLPTSAIYPLSKLTCEQLTYVYRTRYAIDAIAVRPHNMYGPYTAEQPRVPHVFPIHQIMADAMAGKPIIWKVGGDTLFEPTYVKDFARGVTQAYDCKSPAYYVYNLSLGKNRKLSEVFNIMKSLFPDLTIEVGPGMWEGAIVRGMQVDLTYRFTQRPPQDITRAQKDFGYKPEWDIERAIPDWVRWLKEGKY